MRLERLAVVDAAIREALVRIERQRDFVEDFSARGYDMRAPLSLLSMNACATCLGASPTL